MKKKMFYALSALLLCSACTTTPRNPFEEPARPAGQESVLKLACEPLDTVRVGFIGLGSRGKGAIERYVYLPDTHFTATLGIPLTSPALEPDSFQCSPRVKPWVFTSDLPCRLRSLYTQ